MDKFKAGDKVWDKISKRDGSVVSGPWSTDTSDSFYYVRLIHEPHAQLLAAQYLDPVPIEKWDTVDVPGKEIRFKTVGSNWIKQLGISELQVKVR